MNPIRRAGARVLAAALIALPLAAPAQGDAGIAPEDLSCLLEPSTTVKLGTPEPGVIARVLKDRGDRVRRGELVVRMKDARERAAVDLARARVAFGQRKAERNEDLFVKQLISSHEKDEIETEVELARLELAETGARLDSRAIRSPIDGVVVERHRAPGDFAGEDPILTIVSVDPLHVEVIAPVGLLGRIAAGMTAEVVPDVIGGRHRATVSVVDPIVDPTSDTFGVRLELPNPENRLPAGLKCEVHFPPS